MKKIGLFLVSLFFLLFSGFPVLASVPVDPQYVVINRSPTSDPFDDFRKGRSSGDSLFDDVLSKIQTTGTNNRKLALGFIIHYFDVDGVKPDLDRQAIEKILKLSLSKNIPVLIKLDSIFWDGRSDLWNWWNPSKPGYNPDNKENVERTGWNLNTAIKISWFNWGAGQFRSLPPPNLGSPKYIEAQKAALVELIPPIVNWYNSLPQDKKYLLVGVVLDGELSIGVNNFYYPNGNYYLETYPNDTSHDPVYGFVSEEGGKLEQLGYAAVSSYGIKNSGTITQEDLNKVVNLHAQMLGKTALDLGLPFDKIFVHGGGNLERNLNGTLTDFAYSNVVNKFSKPGWSFYGRAYDPATAPGLSAALDQLDNTSWAAAEWLYMGGDYPGWVSSLKKTLSYRNNKFLTVYNWEGIYNNENAIRALRETLNSNPSCWLSPPVIRSSVSGNTVTLSWEKPEGTEALYLNVSNNPERRPSGGIKYINIHNEVVTNTNSKTLSLNPGQYYWQVVADGCKNSTGLATQRRITYGTFKVGEVANSADLNSDSKVNIFDYNILVSNFGKTGNPGFIPSDINKDGKVDIFDYNILVSEFGR